VITTSITHIAHLAELCFQHGIKNIVLSPGSRNAPLIIAFDEHPGIKTWLIHDERCAAFFALGMADALNEPVAIACTSGSAPLNYSPAISEAYYRRIPLLILTADRPLALIDQGDGQTIRQKNVFQNFVKSSFELPDFSIENKIETSDNLVNDALQRLNEIPAAPVHINIPLSEPLYGSAELKSKPEIKLREKKKFSLTADETQRIKNGWTNSKKKLILIGQLAPDPKLELALSSILSQPDVAVLVENTSNLQHFQKIVHCIDRTLALIKDDELENFAPDLLISIGGAIISKKIKAFFRTHKPENNWRVGNYLFEEDTFQSLTHSFAVSASEFFDFVAAIPVNPETNFGDKWKQRDFMALEKHIGFLQKTNWCDLKAFEIILDSIPVNSVLHMGNSSVVRYCQLFNPEKSIHYYSNRGVSGIDGSTSTAAGFSAHCPDKMNILITGDVSFLYDSNALWNNYLQSNFRIIVINNGGGGIFQILDGSNTVKQKDYFFSPYVADISHLCKAFDIYYLSADDERSLETQMNQFLTMDSKRPVLMEVKTFSQRNAEVLKGYFNTLRADI
jgi:2-succinyl-5-enolpyruvyl-6-hydroxy-3-cyclohexene-1-carboxylate synthase